MTKLAVIAYSGETGFDWPLQLPNDGWDYIVLDTGHRTARDHKEEMIHKKLEAKRNNRNRHKNHSFDRDVVSSVENLISEMEDKYEELLKIQRIVNSALLEVSNPRTLVENDELIINNPLSFIPSHKVHAVENIPNMKESAAWLRWIISNYNHLPDRIAFLQGFPFDHCSNIKSILLRNDMYVGFPENSEKEITQKEYLYNQMNYIYEKIHGKQLTSFRWSAGAQFSCSKEFLLSRPLEFYQTLFEEGKTLDRAAEVYERMYWKLIMG